MEEFSHWKDRKLGTEDMKELLTWRFPWLIFRSIFLLADRRGSSIVDVDFPIQVDFLVALGYLNPVGILVRMLESNSSVYLRQTLTIVPKGN